MAETVLILVAGLELKHFLADYVLQTGYILAGKGDFRHGGGYLHAGLHVVGSLIVLVLAGVPLPTLAALCAAEFVIHYLLDYWKIHYGQGVHANDAPKKFWALHGLDQLFHQLTYAAMVYIALKSIGVA